MQAHWEFRGPTDLIHIDFDESDTLDTLKNRMQDVLNHPAHLRGKERAAVFFQGQDLHAQGSDTLGNVVKHIGEQSNMPPGDPRLAFQVCLKMSEIVLNLIRCDGHCFRISVGPQAKICQVKKKLHSSSLTMT